MPLLKCSPKYDWNSVAKEKKKCCLETIQTISTICMAKKSTEWGKKVSRVPKLVKKYPNRAAVVIGSL